MRRNYTFNSGDIWRHRERVMTRLTDMRTGRVGAVALGAWLFPALMGYATDGIFMAFVFTHAWLWWQQVRQATLLNERKL